MSVTEAESFAFQQAHLHPAWDFRLDEVGMFNSGMLKDREQ